MSDRKLVEFRPGVFAIHDEQLVVDGCQWLFVSGTPGLVLPGWIPACLSEEYVGKWPRSVLRGGDLKIPPELRSFPTDGEFKPQRWTGLET